MRHLFSAVAGCCGACEAMHIAVCVHCVPTDHCTQLSGPLVASCYQWVPEYIGDTTAKTSDGPRICVREALM